MFVFSRSSSQDRRDLRSSTAQCQELVPALLRAVDARDDGLVQSVAAKLAEVSDAKARAVLIRTLSNERYGAAAGRALQRVGDPGEIDQIVALSRSGSGAVALRATLVLEQLSTVGFIYLESAHPAVATEINGRKDAAKPKVGEPPRAKHPNWRLRELLDVLGSTSDSRHGPSVAEVDLLGAGLADAQLGAADLRPVVKIFEAGAWRIPTYSVRARAAKVACGLLVKSPERSAACQAAVTLFVKYANPRLAPRGFQPQVMQLLHGVFASLSEDQLDHCYAKFEEGVGSYRRSPFFTDKDYEAFVHGSLAVLIAHQEPYFLAPCLDHPDFGSHARDVTLQLPLVGENPKFLAQTFAEPMGKTEPDRNFRYRVGLRLMEGRYYNAVLRHTSVRPRDSDPISLAAPSVADSDSVVASYIGTKQTASAVLSAIDFPISPSLLSPLLGHWAYFATLNRQSTAVVRDNAHLSPYMLPSPEHFLEAGFSFGPAHLRDGKWRIAAQLPPGWKEFRNGVRTVFYCDEDGDIKGVRYRMVVGGKKVWVSHLWTKNKNEIEGLPLGGALIDPTNWEDLTDCEAPHGQICVMGVKNVGVCFARIRRKGGTITPIPFGREEVHEFEEASRDDTYIRPLTDDERKLLHRWLHAAVIHEDPLKALYQVKAQVPKHTPFSLETYREWELREYPERYLKDRDRDHELER